MSNKPPAKPDYEPPVQTDESATVCFLTGLLGAPLAIVLTNIFRSLYATGACALVALIIVYVARRRVASMASSKSTNRLATIGVVLTFIWAPLFLVWSCMVLLLVPPP